MLDTNMVSHIARRRSPMARARLIDLSDREAVCISAVTAAEIRYGLERTPEATTLNSAIEALLSNLQILPFSVREAQAYGRLRAKLRTLGIGLGNLDMLIAAHAIAAGATLVTADKAFEQVADLSCVNWSTDL